MLKFERPLPSVGLLMFNFLDFNMLGVHTSIACRRLSWDPLIFNRLAGARSRQPSRNNQHKKLVASLPAFPIPRIVGK